MSSAESIVDKNVSHGSQSLAQLGIVLGLALLKTGVLQQHHFAVLQSGSLGMSVFTGHILGHDDGLAQQLGDAVCNHLKAQLGLPLTLGLAHMGAQDDLGIVVHQVLDGGHGSDNTLVGGDFAVLGGDVEVAAAQHPLAGDVDILNGLLVVIHSKFLHSDFCGGLSPHFAIIL